MTAAPSDLTHASVLEGTHTLGSLNDRVATIPLSRFGLAWKTGVGVSALIALAGGIAAAILLYRGVGVWGVNIPVGWGFAIGNFVWWIGIGHAGTFISAILLLLRQSWRNSINRFAEAMTLFAVLNAAVFPLLHLGRFWKFYYLLPYPNSMTVWPQWRSPLVWDAFAVSTYALVSLLFWYLGLIPDLAVMRDTARVRWVRRLAGLAAIGWLGEARQWKRLKSGYLILAGLATALVVSVHSIVSLDFAVSIVPGWNATIFPPYFVAGAIFSGMAMVLTLAIPLRALFRMKDLITTRHLDLMAKVMLTTGLMVGYGYLMEVFTEWQSAEPAERYRLYGRFIGHGAIAFWSTVACNVVVAQSLWFRRVRTGPVLLFIVSLIINVGMWLERFDIVVTSLERDYLPSPWRPYVPTLNDWTLLAGTLGLFTLLFLLFVRFLPVSPIYELKELAHREDRLEPDAHQSVMIPPLRDAAPADDPAGLRSVLVAEFNSAESLRDAASLLAREGRYHLRAYSPMPIDGLAESVGLSRSRLPAFMLAGGLAGGLAGYLLQYLSAVHAYPWIEGGKPMHSWPSFVPITYEMTILGASVVGFVGVLLSCGLPRLHHPAFDIPGFERATRDRFILVVSDSSSQRPEPPIRDLLASLKPVRIFPVSEVGS